MVVVLQAIGDPPGLHEHDAQIVMRFGVIAVELQGFPEARLGVFELILHAEGIAQIAPRGDQIRIDPDGLAVFGFGVLRQLRIGESHSQVVVPIRGMGFQLGGFPVSLDRFGKALQAFQGRTESRPRVRRLRVEAHGFAKRDFRFGMTIGPGQHSPEPEMGIGEFAVEAQGVAERNFGLGQPVAHFEAAPQQAMRMGDLGIESQDLPGPFVDIMRSTLLMQARRQVHVHRRARRIQSHGDPESGFGLGELSQPRMGDPSRRRSPPSKGRAGARLGTRAPPRAASLPE